MTGTAKASIQVSLKGGMKLQMLLLPVAVLGFDGLPPKRLITLGVLIASLGLIGSGKFPNLAQKALTGLSQVRLQ